MDASIPAHHRPSAALKPRAFVIDAEAVYCGDDEVPDFDQLISRGVDREVFAFGFDLLPVDGDDLRTQPLERRRAKLTKVLARSVDGIVLSEHLDGELGSVMFRHACRMGLEGPGEIWHSARTLRRFILHDSKPESSSAKRACHVFDAPRSQERTGCLCSTPRAS